jgi:uncharacterized protein DUF2442
MNKTEFRGKLQTVEKVEPLAIDVSFTENALHVVLADDREISAPLQWFPRLLRATSEERTQWELIGDGIGIHWPLVFARLRSALFTTRQKAFFTSLKFCLVGEFHS